MTRAGDLTPWLALAALGAYHGVNPAMGWLFAVALGMQEKRRAAVLYALLPIALGHLASILLVVLLVRGAELVIPPEILRVVGASILILFGLYKLVRPRSHPRWVGMRVTPPELAVWSALMSTAHGAGLMLFPVLRGLHTAGHGHHSSGIALGSGAIIQDALAVLVHTLAMFLTMGAVALVVYEKAGVAVLRRAWVNLDLVWAVAFVTAGIFTLLVPA